MWMLNPDCVGGVYGQTDRDLACYSSECKYTFKMPLYGQFARFLKGEGEI